MLYVHTTTFEYIKKKKTEISISATVNTFENTHLSDTSTLDMCKVV